MATGDPAFVYPDLDERGGAILCYTSGTTGWPSGVLYSYRSIVLGVLAINAATCCGVRERDVMLPVVPLFPAFSRGLPYAALMSGVRLVVAGPRPTARFDRRPRSQAARMDLLDRA